MNSFELIEKYLPKAVDKYFYEDSKTAILEQGSKFIDVNFNETGYVKIASFLMDGLSDYYQTQQDSNDFINPGTARPDSVGGPGAAAYAAYAGNMASGSRDGFAIGGVDVKWEIFRLQWVRGRQFRIDYIADEETASITIGNAVEEFNRTKVVPEVDVARFGVIASKANASLGNYLSESISANQIIGKFNTAFEWLTEHEVPAEQQVIFVNPSVMTLIRNTTELTKFLTQDNYRSPAGLDFTVEKYMGRPIIEVPSNRFFTNPVFTQNGYRPAVSSTDGADSYVINYMVVSTRAVVPIRKLEYNKIYGPEMSGLAGFHGYLINFLLYHGVVVPKNKIVGTYVSVSSATTGAAKSNTMALTTLAGATQYAWKVGQVWTNPAGLRGKIVYSYSNAFVLGASATIGSGGVLQAFEGVDNSATSGQTTAYFGLLDASSKIIATTGSSAVTLVRHA